METTARVTSKGQITIPKSVRDALGVSEGDVVVFRVKGSQAVVARSVDLIDLAGSLEVPAAKRGMSWQQVQTAARNARRHAR